MADDAAGDPVTFSASGLPTGLSINTSTGVISGTLDGAADADSGYLVTVGADDGTYTDSQSFTWIVSKVAVTSPGDQTNQEGDSVSLTVDASAITGTLSFSASGLPEQGCRSTAAPARSAAPLPPERPRLT